MRKVWIGLLAVLALAAFAATVQKAEITAAKTVTEGMRIVIDPGHGGEDPGKVASDGTLEKDLNLEIALLLGEYLKDQGIEVYYTRQKDMGLYGDTSTSKKTEDLKKRCAIIENVDPELTISIHQNSYPESYVKGAQVFYYSQSPKGEALAKAVQANLKEMADPDNRREAKANDSYYILKKTVSPTVIVECGFLSNPQEAAKLQKEEYQKKLVKAIYAGIVEYQRTAANVE